MDAWTALHEDAVWARLEGRAIARVRGEKPLAFLEDVTTQEVAGLTPGAGALACLLDANGHVEAELRVLALADGSVLLDGEAACGPALERLAKVAPLSGCEITDESGEWTTFAVRGPKAREVVGVSVPEQEHLFVGDDGRVVVRVEWGVAGFDVLAPAGARAPRGDEVDGSVLDAARIVGGRPRFGVDVTPELLVNETPLLSRAVSFTKGCYPGQESVARIQNLGRVRRRLAGLRAEGSIRSGDAVLADGKDVGTVTSAAGTPDGSAAIALLRSEVPDGATLDVAGTRAAVRALP